MSDRQQLAAYADRAQKQINLHAAMEAVLEAWGKSTKRPDLTDKTIRGMLAADLARAAGKVEG